MLIKKSGTCGGKKKSGIRGGNRFCSKSKSVVELDCLTVAEAFLASTKDNFANKFFFCIVKIGGTFLGILLLV